VRNCYKERVADGMEGPAATDELIAMWFKSMDDDDEEAMVFWLALAATQTKLGRLEDRVRDRAISIIDSGEDLERWTEEPGGDAVVKKREKNLQKLKEQLLGPQPAPKRPRVERLYVPDWEPGEHVRYRLQSGKLIILRVGEIRFDGCILSVRDWIGDEVPDPDSILTLAVKPLERHTAFKAYTDRKKDIPYNRLEPLGIKVAEADLQPDSTDLWHWESFDYLLKEAFDWE
jgi:hypothetical protein